MQHIKSVLQITNAQDDYLSLQLPVLQTLLSLNSQLQGQDRDLEISKKQSDEKPFRLHGRTNAPNYNYTHKHQRCAKTVKGKKVQLF